MPAVVVPAKDEQERVAATVAAARALPGVELVVVVDDGSADRTGQVAQAAGARVVRHPRNRGKGAAMTTGAAEVARQLPDAPLLFLDADLGATAGEGARLLAPLVAGEADMTIARFAPGGPPGGGHGLVVALARRGLRRHGWVPTQPLNGQRALTRRAFEAVRPLARGFGVEVGLTADALAGGLRVVEVDVAMDHRVTGSDWRSQVHRGRQLLDVAVALAGVRGRA